jgi:hypothetical protein
MLVGTCKVYLAASLVTGMIDAFYGLIALNDLIFCSFVSPLETKGNQRNTKPKKHQTQGNQRKPKEIKGNQRIPKEKRDHLRRSYFS